MQGQLLGSDTLHSVIREAPHRLSPARSAQSLASTSAGSRLVEPAPQHLNESYGRSSVSLSRHKPGHATCLEDTALAQDRLEEVFRACNGDLSCPQRKTRAAVEPPPGLKGSAQNVAVFTAARGGCPTYHRRSRRRPDRGRGSRPRSRTSHRRRPAGGRRSGWSDRGRSASPPRGTGG